jgi:hypothetical protein
LVTQKSKASGMSIIFASGDSGSGFGGGAAAVAAAAAPEGFEKLYPSWPASSAYVTAVGATRFQKQRPENDEMASDQFGSGGGFSGMVDRTDATWQEAAVTKYLRMDVNLPPKSAFVSTGRATPDVSGLGEGYQVFDSGEKPDSVGGTSASAPMFASLVSLLNEARLQVGGRAAHGSLALLLVVWPPMRPAGGELHLTWCIEACYCVCTDLPSPDTGATTHPTLAPPPTRHWHHHPPDTGATTHLTLAPPPT